MKTISYIPSKDVLIIKFFPVKGKSMQKSRRFELWGDEEGKICALAIKSFTRELEEFTKNLNTTQLGGIWKGVAITDKDIKETRQELLKKLEEKW